jgi:hypothetical protein
MTAAYHGLFAAMALALAFVALRAFQRLRGTTLAAPAAWATAAALAIALVEAALAALGNAISPLASSLLRYTAAVGTFCPLMAVLGAKRPQDRGWQWIVLSLWIALVVPAGQAWLTASGTSFQLPPMWSLLVVALFALLPLNYGPTSRGGKTMFATLGQASLHGQWIMSDPMPLMATGVGLALILVASVWPARPELSTAPNLFTSADAFTVRWLAFRDGWGAFWGLRVMNRINESADAGHWPVRLAWGGFVPVDEQAVAGAFDDQIAPQIRQAMDSLLWRFERRGAGLES